VTAGSSGGTGAAVAASFGVVGLGTDTGNSIRGPSSHNDLVGIRSTMGLTSRAGVVPLNLAADIAGPMARTVTDAALVFQVVAGYDPSDSVTQASKDRTIPDYSKALEREGLKGARLGVLSQAYLTPTTDTEVVRVFARALADLRKQGATVIDSVTLPELDSLRRVPGGGGCNPFKYDFERFLASRNDSTLPVKTLAELIRTRRFHPSIEVRLTSAQAESLPPEVNPGCAARDQFRAGLRAAVLRAMDEKKLDAFVYPTWSNPPRLIGDLNTPAGDNNQVFSPSTGYPAITVPMGYTRGVLPAGLQFFGRPWSEDVLIRLAYGYEQATHWRHEPASTRDGGAGRR
jgi:Asp-tRNA(Asn)/Glu-tRNA(Gln) amidotransferase A subunit family amidase